MRSIDDRVSLSTDSSLADSDQAGLPAAAAPETFDPLVAAAGGGFVPADHGGGATTLTTTTTTHATLALPGIGLGYASLDTLEDTETALVMTSTGLTEFTSGPNGYLVKSEVPMDSELAHIMSFNGAASGFGQTAEAIGSLTSLAFSATGSLSGAHGFDVAGTSAADTIAGSEGSDIIHGAAGADVIASGSGDDIVWGGAGNDSIDGGDGNDQLWGGAGLDTLVGGLGNDLLFGGSGADNLQGGDGNDLLLGGLDNDSLDGGNGDDVLVGGGGADTLTGGAGADLFIFAQGDSGTGVVGEDKVTDFTIGEDKLDLTGFTEKLQAVQAFDHHAFEMVLTDEDNGTLVQIDLNGDGVSDQEILVTTTDNGHLSSSDYII